MDNGNESENGLYIETDLIETTDEEGTVHVFEKVKEIEIDGQEYALLIYRGQDEEEEASENAAKAEVEHDHSNCNGHHHHHDDKDDAEDTEAEEEEVVVMRISYEGDEEVFEAIEDEAEFEKVVAFIEKMDDEELGIDVSSFLDEEPSKN